MEGNDARRLENFRGQPLGSCGREAEPEYLSSCKGQKKLEKKIV